ncbi:MAG: hypothetical protein IJ573_07040 [Clostridia bacterium]|nr:hypothetical protein [Clostridia bacterium]
MKRLLAIFLTLVMPLCFLLAVAASGAAADSILPVLQTPKPEAIEAPAFHALTGRKAPEAEKTESGALRYTYADVSYSEYLDFGRLLAQEGFTLVKSGENAAGAVTAVTGKDHAQLEVTFNQDERFLSVTYTAWTRPAETDAANPAVIDPAAVSALPELIQAISFEAVTAVMPGETKWGGTSYHHAYSGVSYAAYTRFGEKLGEEGYALASSEMLEGGVSRAVVEKDGVSLTLDYDMANQTASVLYPKGVHPRELSLYGDFTELLEGETVQLTESASLTWLGWEKVDSYKEYYKDYRYKPNPKRTSEEHTTGEGVQQVLLRFAVRLEAGEEAETADLIRNMTLYCDKDRLEMNRGLENGERSFNYDDLMVTITAGDTAKEYVVACGAALTDDQLQHPEEVAFTFNDGDNAVRYVCYFESPVDDETRRKDKDHARYGLALAGEILANAADATEAPESGLLAGHCESILKMDFLHPDKVIVIGLNDEQAKKAAAALDAQEYADIAPALAAQMNRDYPEYAAAADRTKAKYTEMETLPAALVLLPCGPHIAAVSFWGKQAGASLIISTAASSEALSAKDIRAYAKELGLSGLRIRVYEGEKRDALLETGKLGSTPLHNLQRSAGATLNRLQKLFPHLTAKGVTTDLPLGALRVFLQKQETADLAAVRAVAEELLLQVTAGQDDPPAHRFLKLNWNSHTKEIPAPEIDLGDEAPEQESEPDPNGTYLFVCSIKKPGTDLQTWTDLIMEASLPAKNIPETPEAADYIIRLATEYDRTDLDLSTGRSGNGIVLHYPLTHITVHDGKSGAMLKDIGWTVRQLSGIVMLPRGDTYWDPENDALWRKVKDLFGE